MGVNKVTKKIKKIFNKPSLIKEWNDTSFKDLPKRWSGAYNRKDGLTEFEADYGGSDIKLGKLYTDKDKPPFATNKQIQELKLKEAMELKDNEWKLLKIQVKGYFSNLKDFTEALRKKNLALFNEVLADMANRVVNQQKTIKKYSYKVKEEVNNEVSEGLKRWKVFIKGESKPLILTGNNEKDVKQIAHAMIRNSSVKIAKVVREGIITEWKHNFP